MVSSMIPVFCVWGVVKSVSAQTCVVTVDELDLEDILLGFDKSGCIVYPKPNSRVLVAFTDNTGTVGVVLKIEHTDRIELMGNENGGIGLTDKIAERLKRLEDGMDNFQTKFNSHLTLYDTHVHTGGTISGSTGTTTPDTGNVSNESVDPRTTQEYISNDNIKHGNG